MRSIAILLLALLSVGCTTILHASPPEERASLTLTFDDGPNPGVTDALLDVLAKHGVTAYFCLIGENVRASPEHEELTRRIAREGHVIVNHGDTADWAWKSLTAGGLQSQIEACDETLTRVLGREADTRWFRPGGGWLFVWQRAAVRRTGKAFLTLDRHDFDALTTPATAEDLTARFLEGAASADLGWVVLHDGMNDQATAAERLGDGSRYDRSFVPELVDRLITEARANGLEVRSAVVQPPADRLAR